MKTPTPLQKTAIALLIGTISSQHLAQAAAIPLVQYPAGSASREPAPNVVISVDNSGSMGSAGITALKDALTATFSASNVPDNRIRLAWQSMHGCNGFPSSGCSNNNTMKPLAGAHRTNFMTFVNGLDDGGYTPSHNVVFNAGKYMQTTGASSPWNKNPGTADANPIACRKAFHIFMTDGEWNGAESGGVITDGSRNTTTYKRLLVNNSGNIDGTDTTLPDGTAYSTTSDQTRVYRDSWGFKEATRSNSTIDTNGINTLADLAFYYWSTDLQPGIANNVVPVIKQSGAETFTSGALSTSLQQYWNPKNDPATWQHLVTYSIGFNNAANLTRPTGTSWPIFDGTTYAGDFNKIVVGAPDATWPSPMCGASGDKPCEAGFGNPSNRDSYTDTAIGRARMYELWHMALNGRGKFVPAVDSNSLVNAFRDILGNILEDTSSPVTNFIGASASISRTGTEAYKSGFASDGWTGYIASDSIGAINGAITPNTAWGMTSTTPARQKTTADLLDALNATGVTNRLILTTRSDTGAGTSFAWSNLSSAQQTLLNTVNGTTDTKGSNRVNYLRGDRTLEANQTGGTFRNRNSRQGDIVNSNIWYLGKPVSDYNTSSYTAFATSHATRTPMLYVGGNDGMLHGFSAVNGEEKIAYIPKGVYKNLSLLTSTDYTHRYYVDGSPFSGDVNISATTTANWRTYLIGTLGAGGKGYYVLDVTQPGATVGTGVATNFSTANASSLVVMDKTADKDDTTIDADIGHIISDPVLTTGNQLLSGQIAKMNNGRWAVVMGNGYNSQNEQAVLLIQYLDGDKALHKISAGTAGDNGLSSPRLLDVNGDGFPDVAYAGDLKGNMWKFNLFGSDASTWGTAFSGNPLYTAVNSSGVNPQPITAAPTLAQNTLVGGLMVAFGTGRNLSEADRTDTSVQTVYAVRDNTVYMPDPAATPPNSKIKINPGVTPAAVGTGRTNLVQQTVDMASATDGQNASAGDTFYVLSNNNVNYGSTGTNPNKRGWYVDLPVAGERVLNAIDFFAGTGVLEIISKVPASGGSTEGETCEPASTPERTFRTFMSIEDGKRPTTLIMDVNGDGYFSNADRTGGTASGDAFTRSNASNVELKISTGKKEKRIGADGEVRDMPSPPTKLLRPSWRQLQ